MNNVFIHLLLIAGTLGIMALIHQKWRINMTLGCLIGGFLLGPLGMNFIPKTFVLTSFFHICLMMFLGIVGLEIPLHRFRLLIKPMMTQGIPQILITSSLLFPLMILLAPSLSYGWCWVLSLGFSFSSTALVLHLLQERDELSTTLGRKALAFLFTQDIGAILLLTFLGFMNLQETTSVFSFLTFLLIIGKILFFIFVAFLMNFCVKKYDYLFSSQESLFLLGFFIILSGAYVGYVTHLSAELGAFLGGMILASSSLRHNIVHTLDPLRPLFVGIFFLSMGLELSRWPSGNQFFFIIVGTFLFMVLKILGIWILTRKRNPAFSLLLGCLMASGSEFIFMMLSLCKNIIDPGTLNIFMFMAFFSFLVSPFLYGKVRSFLNTLIDEEAQDLPLCPSIVIAGFGDLGQCVARLLHHHHLPFLVIDHEEAMYNKIQEQGYEGALGDVRNLDFLTSLGLDNGRVFLITFGHLPFIPQWIRFLKLRFPHLNLCVQVKTYEEAALLSTLDLHIILEEEGEEKGESMSCVAFHALGFSWEKAKTMTHQGLYYHLSS